MLAPGRTALPTVRDAVFRRLLAIADVIAAAGGLAAVGALTSGGLDLVARPLVLDADRLVEGRHRERLQFAPGMTGPWQVLGPKRPPLTEMLETDYLYAANWSLWTDIKILVRAFGHVVAQRGM